jgi:hypothetical protein
MLFNAKGDEKYLIAGIDAYLESLKVKTIADYPKDYALLQHNLGSAYRSLAKLRDATDNLCKAEQAYTEALNIYTFEDFPLEHRAVALELEKMRRTVS